MNKEQKIDYTNKACLYSIGCNAEALLALAQYQPDDKDAVMELILAEETILPSLSKKEFNQKIAYKLCVAFPTHARDILRQLLPVPLAIGLSMAANRAFQLIKKYDADYFNYRDFLNTFPEEAREIFLRLCGNDTFFCEFAGFYQTLKTILQQLPEYRQRFVETLVRQSDKFWSVTFDESWTFMHVAQECSEQRDILFGRYFNVPGLTQENYCFDNADAFVAKLLNLALERDENGTNTFGIINLQIILKIFPEHTQSIFNLICAHPAVLARLLGKDPLKFIELIQLRPEFKDNLLAALRELPPYPGIFGLFTHNVVDADSQDYNWIATPQIIKLHEYFPDDAKPFLERLFNDETLLGKVLSNCKGFQYALTLAIEFPHIKRKFIEAYNKVQGETQFVISEQLIDAAPEEIQPILKILAQATPGDDFGNMTILQIIQQTSDLVRSAVEYIEQHAGETSDYTYRASFPKEMWPWIHTLCKLHLRAVPADLIDAFVQLFPEYGQQLVMFILNNKHLCSTVFDSLPNVIAAAKLAPTSKRQILQSMNDIGNTSIDDLLAAFLDDEDFIIDLIFNDETQFKEFVSVGFNTLCEFAYEHPRHQVTLAVALIRFPRVFNNILYDGRSIYPMLISLSNRQLFVQTLCVNAPMKEVESVDFNNTLTAMQKLPTVIEYFIEYLFSIPNYCYQYIEHDWGFAATETLRGSETQIFSLLCGFPEIIDRLFNLCRVNTSTETCSNAYRSLISIAKDLKNLVAKNDIAGIKTCEEFIVKKYNQGIFRCLHICSLVKFVDRLSDKVVDKSAESPVYQSLQRMHTEFKSRTTFPRLSLLSARVISNYSMPCPAGDLQEIVNGVTVTHDGYK